MKKVAFLLMGILLLSASFALAEGIADEPPKKYDLDIPYGKSVELNFNGFGTAHVQVREGAELHFNVGTIKNIYIIDDILVEKEGESIQDMHLIGRLSVNQGKLEEYNIEE